MRNNAGIYATAEKRCAYVGVCDTGTMVRKRMWLDVYETEDFIRWKHTERLVDEVNLFEVPWQTRAGDFFCSGSCPVHILFLAAPSRIEARL